MAAKSVAEEEAERAKAQQAEIEGLRSVFGPGLFVISHGVKILLGLSMISQIAVDKIITCYG